MQIALHVKDLIWLSKGRQLKQTYDPQPLQTRKA